MDWKGASLVVVLETDMVIQQFALLIKWVSSLSVSQNIFVLGSCSYQPSS